MEGIIDFHAHAFPDDLAGRAIKVLEREGGVKAHLDGRVSSLLSSMDESGIEKSVVCSIATKPAQFDPILTWSKKIGSERIIPIPSVHPDDPRCLERISQLKGEGFKGVKLHPYYQNFYIDDEKLFPLYEEMCEHNLLLVLHTGFDIAFPPIRRADPEQILYVREHFPTMRLVTTHLGSWKLWAEVEKSLIGKQVYMEMSMSLEFMGREEARKLLLSHDKNYILFGTDSPWTSQRETIKLLKGLQLGEDLERLILKDNAINLLGAD